MKHYKSLTALLIAGLLLLSSCDKTPSEVSEGDMPQSESVSEAAVSENISSTEDESSVSGETSEEPSETEISVPEVDYLSESLGEGKISLLKMPGKRPDDGDLYTIADAQGKLLYPFQFNRIERLGTEETEYVALYTKVNSLLFTVDGVEVALPHGEYSKYTYINGAVAAYRDSTESYLLIGSDGKPYESIPEYQEFHPERPRNGMLIMRAGSEGKDSYYLRFSGKGKFDVVPYNEAQKNAVEAKSGEKILEVFNAFIYAAQKRDTNEMLKYATEELVSYANKDHSEITSEIWENGLDLPQFIEFLVTDESNAPELAKKQQMEANDLSFIYIDDSEGGHSEALFYLPELVIIEYEMLLSMCGPYKLSVVCDGNGGFKLDGIWRNYEADKELLPPRRDITD